MKCPRWFLKEKIYFDSNLAMPDYEPLSDSPPSKMVPVRRQKWQEKVERKVLNVWRSYKDKNLSDIKYFKKAEKVRARNRWLA